jgi:hypothetical protein
MNIILKAFTITMKAAVSELWAKNGRYLSLTIIQVALKIEHERAKGLLEDFCKDNPSEDITVLQTERRGKDLIFRRVPLENFDPEATEGLVDAFIESIGALNEGAEALHEKQLLELYSKRKLTAPVSLGIIINSQEEDEEVEVVDKK